MGRDEILRPTSPDPTYLAHYHLEVELRANLEEPRRNDMLADATDLP
jgi:hypothetical protein